jgi:hypothetical protein
MPGTLGYKLAPCRKCGGETTIRKNRTAKNYEWWVECNSCDLLIMAGNRKMEAVVAYNSGEWRAYER